MSAKSQENGISEYLNHIKQFPVLSREEERELLIKTKQGDEDAKNRLVESSLRYVVSVARKCSANYTYNKDMLFQEFIQEGNYGLLQAIERFDVEKGVRLATYATSWIIRNIRRYQLKNRIIQCPRQKLSIMFKIEAAEDEYLRDNGKLPEIKDVAEILGLTEEEVLMADAFILSPVSLEQQQEYEDNPSTLLDRISDNEFEEMLDQALLKEDILNWMNKELNEKEIIVMKQRYGIDGEDAKGLREIGSEIGRSYEAVRQTEMRAKDKLLNSKEVDFMKSLLFGN